MGQKVSTGGHRSHNSQVRILSIAPSNSMLQVASWDPKALMKVFTLWKSSRKLTLENQFWFTWSLDILFCRNCLGIQNFFRPPFPPLLMRQFVLLATTSEAGRCWDMRFKSFFDRNRVCVSDSLCVKKSMEMSFVLENFLAFLQFSKRLWKKSQKVSDLPKKFAP